MLTNSKLTIYHKGIDTQTRDDKWIRFNYSDVWFFGGKGAGLHKGYDNANDVDVRIPYNTNDNLDVRNFEIGDIIVQGELDTNIETSKELVDNGYLIYNITSITNNLYGKNKHIHIGGK